MKLLLCFVLLLIAQVTFSSISNIGAGPTGLFAELPTTQGLVLSVFLILTIIAGEFGIVPIKGTKLPSIIGKSKRSTDTHMMHLATQLERDSVLKVAKEVDAYDCGLKYLCEVAGLDESEMTFDEMLLTKITKLGDDDPFTMMQQNPENPLFPYTMAGYVGRSTRGKKCTKTFKNCPHDLAEMRKALEKK